MPTALVTVGSTRFDDLTRTIATTACLAALKRLGYTKLVIQHGSAPAPPTSDAPMDVVCFDYKPSLKAEMESADLVISHAGTPSPLITYGWLGVDSGGAEDGQATAGCHQ